MAATISKTLFSSLSIDFWAMFVYHTLELRTKITLFVLLSAGIVLGYFSFISWTIGFLIAKYLGGKTVGKPGRLRSHFIPLGKHKIHLHHWLLSSCAIIMFTVFKGAYVLPSDLFYGFFGGIVFHGIYWYRDWYKILVSRRVQSLVAKNLAIEKFAASASSIATGEGCRQLEMTSKED